MTKKTKTKAFSFQGFDAQHYKTTEQYAAAVDALFDRATKAIADAAAKGTYNPDKPFSFDDYPSVKAYAQKIITGLANNITSVVTNGSRKQWLFACQKNDEFINSIIDTSKVSKARLNKMQDRNLDAMKTFQGRKVDGMNLSERVWKYTQQFKAQIELGLDVGLGEGRSAQQLSRDLRQNLQDPDRLFRRVRDKRGNLQLSKAAKAFHPGIGVYRSSAKNAARLTRSEINMAYREADWMRWQQLDFVVGFEIKTSNRHEEWLRTVWNKSNKGKIEICDKMKGRYPKTFKFKGWHPQCMCFAIPILMDEETFDNQELSDLKSALRGEPYKKLQVKNAVTDVPDGFKDWVAENTSKQENWGSIPYFVRDNFKEGNLSKGLNIATKIEQKSISSLDDIIQLMDKNKVEYKEVKLLSNPLTEKDIISRVGGGDLTRGSCSSLAFAYAGNKCGFDVLDFRDGVSRQSFSSSRNIMDIAAKVGGVVSKHTSDYIKASQLLKITQTGKEYYFTCGSHSAIVRKTPTGYEYLELQSATNNGFKELTNDVLKYRFGAKKSHSSYGNKFDTTDCIIDIDLLRNNNGFKKMLGYINTNESEQKKGQKGTMK